MHVLIFNNNREVGTRTRVTPTVQDILYLAFLVPWRSLVVARAGDRRGREEGVVRTGW